MTLVDPNFNKKVFERKVELHIKCGYTKDLAECKVLMDYNGYMGMKNKKKVDKEGNFI